MRLLARPLAALSLTILGACGSITDPSSPSALAARRPRNAHTPILFVHGFNSNESIWTTMIGRFKKDGWQSSELASFTYTWQASNATTAGIIASKVDSILLATSAPRVAIVGHSMGTLSARYYLKNTAGATDKVSALVSLAGANHGTNLAIFCLPAESCSEMVPGSAFLTALNSVDETPGATNYRTWWSPCDEVISPRQSMLLEGATNTQTACLTHSAMYTDTKVYGQVRDFVNSATVNVNVFAN
jgi:triacylglycerol esterase/lipase EstA (alpha/beta hydrolase family)